MKKWYKKPLVWVGIAAVLLLIFLVPVLIGLAFGHGGGADGWLAEDILEYSGAVLSSVAAVILGIIAVRQTDLANELTSRQLKLEYYPSISITPNPPRGGREPKGMKQGEVLVLNGHRSIYHEVDAEDVPKRLRDDLVFLQIRNGAPGPPPSTASRLSGRRWTASRWRSTSSVPNSLTSPRTAPSAFFSAAAAA